MSNNLTLDELLTNFKELTAKPESFLNSDDVVKNKIKGSLKQTYDLSKNAEIKSIKSDALPELIVQNFDQEQVWQQIELQNDSLLTRSLINVSKLIVNKNRLFFKIPENDVASTSGNASTDEEDTAVDAADEVAGDVGGNDDGESDDVSFGEDDFSENDENDKNKPSASPQKRFKPSVVDDDFFKLNEMESFLNAEEKKLNDPDSGNDSDNSDDSEGSINLFEAHSEDEEDKVKTAKYKDFFVEANDEKQPKRNKFLHNMDDDDDDDEDNTENNQPSTLELRQARLKKKIDELEEKAVGEKPWQLKGEITAEGRPQNSLLEEVVEFDLTSRPAPVFTEQTTLQLEDIIRQRIKDKVFDSVERKVKPVETPLEYKKKLVLDQEKSKQSLAQIYEKDYLDQQAALDPENQDKDEEEPELHKEVKTMMHSLFNKLDALSNFHFTPKPAVPELKIVCNLPAVSMEEVAPVAASEAALLAPEEVRNKTKGDLIGKSERSETDKKRERRKKKLKQHEHVKLKEKKQSAKKMTPGLGNKYTKEKAKKMLQKVAKGKNVDLMDETSGKTVKSSTAFFTQLQEEVQSHISQKVKKIKKKKNTLEAKKFKL